MKRQRLYERDMFDETDKINIRNKSNGVCSHCGKELFIGNAAGICKDNLFTIDHFIPLNRGGSNVMVNLVPLCFPCNEKKGQMILDPDTYLNYLDAKHKKDIQGMYEGYIGSFDYLSRNNLLANDLYEFNLPVILDHKKYFQMNNKRIDKMLEKKGITFYIHRAGMDDVERLTEYFAGYLKKYGRLKSVETARANILWWLINGCIYYTEDKQGNIKAFNGLWADMRKNKMTSPTPVLRSMPVFYYTNEKNRQVFETLTDDIIHLIIEENKLPWLSVEVILIGDDMIDKGTVYMRRSVRYDSARRYKIYKGRFMSPEYEKYYDEKEKLWKLEPKELKELEDKHKTWFEKIEINKEKLKRFIHENIYPPFSIIEKSA